MNMTAPAAPGPVEAGIADQFGAVREALPGAGVDWVARLRQDGIDRFRHAGLPHRRLEEYKYTDLRALLREVGPAATGTSESVDIAELPRVFADTESHRIVIHDGRIVAGLEDLNRVEGVKARSLHDGLSDGSKDLQDVLGLGAEDADAIWALNTAFMSDGLVLEIVPGAVLSRPVEIVHHASSGTTISLRHHVVLGEGAHATVLESFTGSREGGTVNVICTVALERAARLDHVRLQEMAGDSVQLTDMSVVLGEKALLNTFSGTRGARVSRSGLSVRFAGEGAHADIAGGYMIGGSQHCDTTLFVDHAVPECTSTENFKGVIGDTARGVFQGKIVVQPDAQKTDARMMTKGLLLSEAAEFDAKPELEIFADDVQCAHGATSGELDETHLFYLMSRGIPEMQARAMLVGAFIAEAADRIADERLREIVAERLTSWFGGTGEKTDA